jgi:uncharacterized protein (TIGR02679 family)
VDLPRLRRLLGGPETAWLVQRVRDRLAAGRPLDTSATLRSATPEQRRAAESLLGRRLRSATSLTVPLAEVDRVLRESLACPDGLAAAVVALTGPVADKRAQDAALAASWEQALAELDHPAVTGRPELATWQAMVASTGLLKRLSGGEPATARRLAADAVRVLTRLPADGLALPVLAARTVGDAHALDEGRPLTRLVLAAVRHLAELPAEATAGADGRRAAWAAVGVARDELSSRVLTLGLPGSGNGAVGRMLAAARDEGEPAVLTLRQTARRVPDLGLHDRLVRVCENPAVLAAAADELGPGCPPLICTEGTLSAAARGLLRHLLDRGCRLAFHGDFDWGGVRIATGLLRLFDATPWRYDATSYLAAVDRGLGTPLTTGSPAPTPWNPALGDALGRHRVRVEEEHLIDELLNDLRGS